MENSKEKKTIIILIAVLAIVCVIGLWPKKDTGKLVAVVRVNGVVNQEIVLDGETEVIETGGGYYVPSDKTHASDRVKVLIDVQKDENGIKIIKTNCPDQKCMEVGYINKLGDTLTCEYGQFEIKLEKYKK